MSGAGYCARCRFARRFEKDLVVGYSLPTIETYHKLKLERAHKTKRMIDEIEEATSLEFEIRESIILQ